MNKPKTPSEFRRMLMSMTSGEWVFDGEQCSMITFKEGETRADYIINDMIHTTEADAVAIAHLKNMALDLMILWDIAHRVVYDGDVRNIRGMLRSSLENLEGKHEG